MKRLFVLIVIFGLFLTGCSVTNLNGKNIDDIVNTILVKKSKLKNTNFDGYSYYTPRGLYFINKNDYNSILRDNSNNYYYMYTDVVSYYHKIKKTYKENADAYYSKTIKNKDKFGYIEINKEDSYYFIELMYNYTKIEAYVKEKNLDDALTNICTILSSVKYNDKVLATTVGENELSYKEETFNIFKTKKKATDFLDYVKEYDEVVSYFTVGPSIGKEKAVTHLVKMISLEKLLLETDGIEAVKWAIDSTDYLQALQNEVTQIAKIKNKSYEETEHILDTNFKKLKEIIN